MPKRSNQFQRLAAAVHQRMSPQGWEVTESKMLPDAITGELREVDVVVSGSVMGHEMRLCVECRDHGRPGDVTWIEQAVQKHSNLPTSKLVLWSRSGFTKSAITKAKHLKIDLVSAHDLQKTDWARKAKAMVGARLELVTPSLSAFVDLTHADGRQERIENEDAWESAIFDAAGSKVGTLRDLRPVLLTDETIRNTVLDHAPVGAGDFWIQIVPPDGDDWFVRSETGELTTIHRLGVGMVTQREHLPVEVASVPRNDKVITLASARKADGSMFDLYLEESRPT